MSGATLQQWLQTARGTTRAGLRFVDGAERERVESWDAVAARAARVAGGLAAAGVAPGDRVALVYPTAPEFFDALFGALLAGAVPVPLYPPVRLGRLAEYHARTAAMLRAAGAVLLLVDGRLRPLLGEAVAAARPALGARRLDELPAAAPLVRDGDPDALALVQFSSGTTTQPKPVALTHRAVVAQVAALNAHWPDSAEVRHSGVSWLPLYHDMGLIGCVLPALERRAELTLLPPERFVARPALWLRALSRHRATISVAPNFAYALACERIRDDEMAGCDLSAWRVALCGAEAVSAATLRAFAARFARWGFRAEALTPVYGLSEAALAVTFGELERPFVALRVKREALARDGRAVADDGGVELVAVGRPLPGFTLSLRDESGGEVPPGRVGRLFVRGPSLLREYLGQPEATAAALRDGWLDTGDLGFLHDGELVLTGRAKDVLIVRGANHSPEEVERAVDAVPGVRRGCAVAVSARDDGDATERVLLFVEHRRGASRRAVAALAARCREAIVAATGLAVDEVRVLAPGALPRTSSGKLRRGETLARHRAGALSPPPRFGALAL
ncbi:MAG: AMP-binding protein, partial [Thermoanaerobaculia bacterium]|nr:AMP-binding protein [Thermoanaerobaculia bacterium]